MVTSASKLLDNYLNLGHGVGLILALLPSVATSTEKKQSLASLAMDPMADHQLWACEP
jgi:hypothetical protein